MSVSKKKKENQLNDIASVYIDSVNKEKDLSIGKIGEKIEIKIKMVG